MSGGGAAGALCMAPAGEKAAARPAVLAMARGEAIQASIRPASDRFYRLSTLLSSSGKCSEICSTSARSPANCIHEVLLPFQPQHMVAAYIAQGERIDGAKERERSTFRRFVTSIRRGERFTRRRPRRRSQPASQPGAHAVSMTTLFTNCGFSFCADPCVGSHHVGGEGSRHIWQPPPPPPSTSSPTSTFTTLAGVPSLGLRPNPFVMSKNRTLPFFCCPLARVCRVLTLLLRTASRRKEPLASACETLKPKTLHKSAPKPAPPLRGAER